MSEKGSVFQKGGGGTDFEQAVQTAFLISLIIIGNAPCLPANEIIEVGFQNTKKGYETDDLLVYAKSESKTHRLLIQIKHDISFTKGNEKFNEVIRAFWKDFNNTTLFDQTTDKLIIVKNGLTKDERNHLKSLFNWANTHANEVDFILEVNRIKSKKERLEIFRECLMEANNNVALTEIELWKFIKCMDVLEYDFLNEGSVDETYFMNLIKLSKRKQYPQNEKEIWGIIFTWAAMLNKDGGNVTTESIKQEELYKYFAAENLNPYIKAVEKLISDSKAILNPIKNTIAGLLLDRRYIKESIINYINTFQITIVTGKPGVGKSAEIKDILEQDFPSANLIVFRADQFNKPTIANVLSGQGVNEAIQDIFSCISLIPDKIIFIDSLEKLLEADPECAFKQLLALLKEFTDIKVIASSRKYAIDLIIQKFGLDNKELGIVEVLPLKDSELSIVSERFPQLEKVLKNHKIKSLLQSPKYLDFAITALNRASDDYSDLTLTAFKNKLWNSMVVDSLNTKDGLPIKREKAFMEIAIKRAKEMKLFTQPVDADEAAIFLLEHDEIIFQENQNRKYTPAHDILEDWALIRYIASKYEGYPNPKEMLENLGNEPAIRRAFRLWVEDNLFDASDKISSLIKTAIKDDSVERYWADELLVAVFKSENCSSFFLSFEKELLDNNAQLLNRCLHLIKTCCKESNPTGNDFTLLLPIGSGWKEALLFINKHLSQLDFLRLSICNFLIDWQYRVVFQYVSIPEDELFASKEIIINYLNQIESRHEFWEEEFAREKAKDLISILYSLAQVAKEEIQLLIRRALNHEKQSGSWKLSSFYKSVIEKCLTGVGNQRLVKELPELVVETAWKTWKIEPEPEPELGSVTDRFETYRIWQGACWGIKDNCDFFPSGIYKTPAFNLLCFHTLKGLEFIVSFINYAVDYNIKSDCENKQHATLIEIKLNDGTIIKQWGSWELWTAYRGISVTHYAIESLLMSLEKYLLEIAGYKNETSKKNVGFVFAYILKNSNNVATSSVLTSVAIAYPEEVEEAMLPLFTAKEYYEWDLSRALQESSTLAPLDNKIPISQEERWKFNQLPHRKKYMRGLRDFIVDYQFNIRKLNKEIHHILDMLKTRIEPGDISWKKALTEMDIRNHRLGDYDEKLGGFPIRPEYEQDVVEFLDSNKDQMEAQTKSMNYSSLISKAYDGNEPIGLQEWETCYNDYLKPDDLNLLYDRPVSLAILGLRDFLANIDNSQKEWCLKTLVTTIANILKNTFERNNNLTRTYNIIEKEVALSSFHFIFSAIDNEEDKNVLVGLMIYMLFAPFAPYEIDKITKYVRTIFFKHNPVEGKKVCYGLLKYAQFRKTNPYFYDDNPDRLIEIKKKEAEFIEAISQSADSYINPLEINFQNCEGYLLNRAFVITPYYIEDTDYFTFIKHFILLLVEELKHDEDSSYSSKRGRQISFEGISVAESYVAELLLKADKKLSQQVLDLILDPVYSSGYKARRSRDDLFDFPSDVLKKVIYNLDEIISNSMDNSLNEKYIINFWALWEHLFHKIRTSGKPYFSDSLFLDIGWKREASHWHPLEGKKEFYHEIVNELGSNNTQSMINILSTIGEKTFLPDGLSWLVEIFIKDEKLEMPLRSPSAERLIKRLFYNHISTIKNDKQLINDFIWLLNKMVDIGSSEAYMFRENVITYKHF